MDLSLAAFSLFVLPAGFDTLLMAIGNAGFRPEFIAETIETSWFQYGFGFFV